MGSRWIRWAALGASALIGALAAAAWLAAPWYVRTRVLPDLLARYGLTMAFERHAVSIADGTADLHGVRLFDGSEEVLTAKRMRVRISLRGLYGGRTIVERLVFDDPVIHARLEPDGRTNIGRILRRPSVDPRMALRPATLWKQVLIHGGRLECTDRTRGVTFRILDIEATLLDVQTGKGERQDRFGQISVDAKLEQPGHEAAPLAIVHWATLAENPEPTFVTHVVVTGIDLDSFPGYIDATQRASLGVDHLDLLVSLDVRKGIIRRGAAVATSPERTRPLTLLFGGNLDAPILDGSSKLLALWELPFARLGRVGDVAWEAGSAVVGGAIDVVEALVQGDPLGAGESAAEGLGGGIQAFGSGALDLIEGMGRALGLVDPEKPRDPTAIHAHQRELFLASRRAAEQAWSRAHAAKTEAERSRHGDQSLTERDRARWDPSLRSWDGSATAHEGCVLAYGCTDQRAGSIASSSALAIERG
jgi:hypothetical protein